MSSTDMMIFVTGVVGRSMGSGKFEADDIDMLTQRALDAFQAHLAPKLAQSAPAPSPSPGASGGPQKPAWNAAAAAVGGEIGPETKSFSIWGGDKAFLREDTNRIWGDWVADAQQGDVAAREALVKASRASIGTDPKWHANNTRRIARAKACLAMLSGQP